VYRNTRVRGLYTKLNGCPLLFKAMSACLTDCVRAFVPVFVTLIVDYSVVNCSCSCRLALLMEQNMTHHPIINHSRVLQTYIASFSCNEWRSRQFGCRRKYV